jgi:hypothetical protein
MLIVIYVEEVADAEVSLKAVAALVAIVTGVAATVGAAFV